jgi:putative glutamine amidotransferase
MGRPLILVTPSPQDSGVELLDPSISVGNRYLEAVIEAGGLPLVLPLTTDRSRLAEYLTRADGVMLTGGDDIDPRVYWPEVPAELLARCDCAGPVRDTMELTLLDEVFRNPRPLLAICRGHQLVNVALGGTLYVDLASQRPGDLVHARMEHRFEPVHEVAITADSQASLIWKRGHLGVNSTHHQAIHRIADPLQASLIAPDGVIEGTELRPEHAGLLPWYASVQFHPERLDRKHPEHALLFRAFVETCTRFQK